MKTPKPVGLWIFEIMANEITKYGLDGGCEYPLEIDTPEEEVLAQVEHLRKNAMPRTRYYIIRVFDNGQMVHHYATDRDA
jgi:hypothetical protein